MELFLSLFLFSRQKNILPLPHCRVIISCQFPIVCEQRRQDVTSDCLRKRIRCVVVSVRKIYILLFHAAFLSHPFYPLRRKRMEGKHKNICVRSPRVYNDKLSLAFTNHRNVYSLPSVSFRHVDCCVTSLSSIVSSGFIGEFAFKSCSRHSKKLRLLYGMM